MENSSGSGAQKSLPSTKSTSLFLQIVEHPDGTVTRPPVPVLPPSGDQPDADVLSRDVPLNPPNGTWLRIYRPNPLPPAAKLPVIIYFHGGGFVVFSSGTAFYHAFCEAMVRHVSALVVSVDYRLAPEHRLPAAYEDAAEAVLWLRSQLGRGGGGDPWLARHGDASRCFLMGSSSGANMAYHAGLLLTALELHPVKFTGLILNQPYFGGEEMTPSETRSEEDQILPLRANQMLWRLALPEGADRDHRFCNPVAAVPAELRHLPMCLVTGCEGDPLVDRQRQFVEMMEKEGSGGGATAVVAKFREGGFHAAELLDPEWAETLIAEVRAFVASAC
ncbi:probable carboxylesterase 8 [Zingiber officinale]|uniref:Alpha/beta hydrolase fold-3 domain-containing protein n=1 Tax=Zingiber officinale TaxID=94328 RepID=A0A8J5FRG5_ZINOF|nr:probable carboxylesterase 8 [Zingiber officinale]KAG6493628.1 hypothetical protein ZIOFF_048621 [Zingiber officinale]